MPKATRKTTTTRKTSVLPDPISEAIENHQKLEKAWCDLTEALEEAVFEAGKKHGRPPTSVVSWRTEYWDVKARLLGTELAGKEWDERAVLMALQCDVDCAHTAWWRAAPHMAPTKPCTPAGARALLTETLKDVQMVWCESALGTVVQALAAMEAASPRSPIMKAA